MIKKQLCISNIDENEESFIIFDILLTTNINDVGVKEPYIYPEWVEIDAYSEWDSEEEYLKGIIKTHNDKIYKCDESHISDVSFETDLEKWMEIGTTSNEVMYNGESRIDEFKRYGKTINDGDLYTENLLMGEGGISKKIFETKPKIDPFSKQYIYKYNFFDSNNEVITTYDDVGDGTSIIKYETKGLNRDNAINLPSFKNEELLSVTDKPKVEVDVFIDRGINNAFDRHIKIGDVKTLESLEKYGNGFFKIKE